MPFDPTNFVNNQQPAIDAAQLNKLGSQYDQIVDDIADGIIPAGLSEEAIAEDITNPATPIGGAVSSSSLPRSLRGAVNGVASLGSDTRIPDAQLPTRLSDTSLTATIAALVQWAKNPEAIITGAIVRNADGIVTSAAVIWPDGKGGTFTTDSIVNGAINSDHVTHVDGSTTRTYTQPTITRDSSGSAITVPQIVVS